MNSYSIVSEHGQYLFFLTFRSAHLKSPLLSLMSLNVMLCFIVGRSVVQDDVNEGFIHLCCEVFVYCLGNYPPMAFYLSKTGRPIYLSCEYPLYQGAQKVWWIYFVFDMIMLEI